MINLNTKLHTFTSWVVIVFELRADELGTELGVVNTGCSYHWNRRTWNQHRCTGNWLKCTWVMIPIVVFENTWLVRQSRWIHKWVRVKHQIKLWSSIFFILFRLKCRIIKNKMLRPLAKLRIFISLLNWVKRTRDSYSQH